MAFNVALLEATKNHAKYLVTGDDTNTGALDGNAVGTPGLNIDIPAGVLHNLCVGPYANQAAARLAVYGDATHDSLIRITHHHEVGVFETLVDVTGVGGALRLTLTCRAAGTIGTLLVEFRPSLGR